jgi:hypothetical protein
MITNGYSNDSMHRACASFDNAVGKGSKVYMSLLWKA